MHVSGVAYLFERSCKNGKAGAAALLPALHHVGHVTPSAIVSQSLQSHKVGQRPEIEYMNM